jgi:hypothetical protein
MQCRTSRAWTTDVLLKLKRNGQEKIAREYLDQHASLGIYFFSSFESQMLYEKEGVLAGKTACLLRVLLSYPYLSGKF